MLWRDRLAPQTLAMPYTFRLIVAIGLSSVLAVAGCARGGPGVAGKSGAPSAATSLTKMPGSNPTPGVSRPRDHLRATLSTGMGDEWDLEVVDSLGQLAMKHFAGGDANAGVVVQLSDSAGTLYLLREAEGVWRWTPEGAVMACHLEKASVLAPPGQSKPAVTVTPKDAALIVHTTEAGVSRNLGFKLEFGC
ncbi:hypothetical protein Rhe02_02580 [Rhizocola hellebori]|uniref:Lipoprotein n=1 Tax=Rhizocola hellebori TaxID=1392758 RepID=A0A8J3Q220_9ACTN|nr:hypothetical protein [Rhizocola hellebori]GIH02191.1 hypothetical protein Rhe02_02580 [Rhizocola hellebori]